MNSPSLAPTVRPIHCAQHGAQTERGISQLSQILWLGCPVCRDEKQQQQQARQRAEQIAGLVATAQIPPNYAACTASSFRRTAPDHIAAFSACASWLDEVVQRSGRVPAGEAATVLLMGASGRGKSHLCAATVKAWISRTLRGATYTTAADIESAAARRFQGGQETIDTLCRLPLLALDELGGEQAGELSRSAVARVINARYDARLPTILGTNLDSESVLRRYGQGVADRLLVDGIVCEFRGQTLRGGGVPA